MKRVLMLAFCMVAMFIATNVVTESEAEAGCRRRCCRPCRPVCCRVRRCCAPKRCCRVTTCCCPTNNCCCDTSGCGSDTAGCGEGTVESSASDAVPVEAPEAGDVPDPPKDDA